MTGSAVDPIVEALRAAGCVWAEDEAVLLREAAVGSDQSALDRLVARRCAGEPLEHVVGWAEFAGHRVRVVAPVFVPRRRTEALVEVAIAHAVARDTVGGGDGPLRVVDLCCGSGALGLAVSTALRPTRQVLLAAGDVDVDAVACARTNLTDPDDRVAVGDLFDVVPVDWRGHVDVLLANVPYVPTAEVVHLPAEARVHERAVALDGGSDGLDLFRRVVAEAPDWLAAGGTLFSEIADDQVDAAVDALQAARLTATVHHDKERDALVVVGTQASGPDQPQRIIGRSAGTSSTSSS